MHSWTRHKGISFDQRQKLCLFGARLQISQGLGHCIRNEVKEKTEVRCRSIVPSQSQDMQESWPERDFSNVEKFDKACSWAHWYEAKIHDCARSSVAEVEQCPISCGNINQSESKSACHIRNHASKEPLSRCPLWKKCKWPELKT